MRGEQYPSVPMLNPRFMSWAHPMTWRAMSISPYVGEGAGPGVTIPVGVMEGHDVPPDVLTDVVHWVRRYGPADVARHVMGSHVTQETGVRTALGDLASKIRQARRVIGCSLNSVSGLLVSLISSKPRVHSLKDRDPVGLPAI